MGCRMQEMQWCRRKVQCRTAQPHSPPPPPEHPPPPAAAEVSISPAAEVQEGTATTLSCVVPGQEGRELNYTWYRNGAWLQQSPAHRMLLPRAAASDAGFYSCTASDAWGSAAAPALGLSVTCEWPRGGCGAVEWVGRGPTDQPASCTRIHLLQRVLGLQGVQMQD